MLLVKSMAVLAEIKLDEIYKTLTPNQFRWNLMNELKERFNLYEHPEENQQTLHLINSFLEGTYKNNSWYPNGFSDNSFIESLVYSNY
jgi:hypothetical protein